MIGRQGIGNDNLGYIELQSVEHHTGVGIGLVGFRHSTVGDNHGLAFRHVESNKRRAGVGGILSSGGECHTCSYDVAIHEYFNVGLCLIFVRIIMVGFQRVLAGCHAGNGEYQRCRAFSNLRHVSAFYIGGQHLVSNYAEAVGLYVGLAPVAAHGRGGTTSTDGNGHAIVKIFGIARGAGYCPRDVVNLRVFAGCCLARQVKIDVLSRCSKSASDT